MVPPDHLLPRYKIPPQTQQTQPTRAYQGNSPTVNLLEHLPHPLDIVMIQIPRLWIFLVFFKGDTERVGDVDGLAVVLPEEDADYTFGGGTSECAGMVVCY